MSNTVRNSTVIVVPLLLLRWATVCDADPALKQHWHNVSCLLVKGMDHCMYVSDFSCTQVVWISVISGVLSGYTVRTQWTIPLILHLRFPSAIFRRCRRWSNTGWRGWASDCTWPRQPRNQWVVYAIQQHDWAHILVQNTIYRRHRTGRYDHLDQSDIS